MGGHWCVCIYAQMLLKKKKFVFQKDLTPHFGVFVFVNLTDLCNVTNSQKNCQSLLVSICYLSYTAVYFSVGCRTWSPAFSKKERACCGWQMQWTDTSWVYACVPTCSSSSENTDLQPIWWKNFEAQTRKQTSARGNVKHFSWQGKHKLEEMQWVAVWSLFQS